MKISDLIPDNKNFNTGSEFGNSLIEKSFRKFGAGRSILLDKNNRIIAGNKSVENAAAIGIEDVQVVESDGKRIIAVKRMDIDLDTPQGRELALADNATAKANIVFDAELIEAELGEAVCVEWGIDVSVKLEAEEDEFDVPEGGIETDIVLGDLFEIGQHRLLCGDSTCSDTVAKLMDGQEADMVFTDPPYGVNYEGGTGSYANGKIKSRTSTTIKNDLQANLYNDINPIIHLFLKEGAIYVWYADKFIQEVLAITEGLELRSIINWYKIKQGFGDMGSNYHSVSEPCLYLVKGKSNFVGENNETNIWELQRPQKNNLHPTQKPIELPERAIKNSSLLNNIVLDLFLGSGTTMVAAHQLNRKCYGMELDPKYVQTIVNRMIKLDPTLTIKRNGEPYTPNNA